MSLGIYDADFNRYGLIPFNLQCMKLSAFYKRNAELVVFNTILDPQRHKKIFYRQDFQGKIPIEVISNDNIIYGGLAFTNNKYMPLDQKIELMKPDPTIYQHGYNSLPIKKTKYIETIYKNLMSAQHCRLSLDGQNIWDKFESQFTDLKKNRNLIIHDYNINNIINSYQVIKQLLKNERKSSWKIKLGMKFPIIISNGEQLLKWSQLNSNAIFYSLQYDGVIPEQEFNEWMNLNIKRTTFKAMDYYVTRGQSSQKEFLDKELIKIYHQVLISRSYRVFFLLKYDEEFFTDKRWINVLRLMNFYMNSMSTQRVSVYYTKIQNDTMYDFACASGNIKTGRYKNEMLRQEIRDTFQFVREKNPELFQDFYSCSAETLGGKL